MAQGFSENFREKVKYYMSELNADVANQANLIVSLPLTTSQTYLFNVKATQTPAPTTEGQIYLQQQDVFLTEKVAYYYRCNVVGAYTQYKMSDQQSPQTAALETFRLYEGSISYSQNRTVVSAGTSLQEFNCRENLAIGAVAATGLPAAIFDDFNLDKCSKELIPYWLLSGARDNGAQLDFANPFVLANMPANCRLYICMRGVILPNVAPNLNEWELRQKNN